MAHNGNLVNAAQLRQDLEMNGAIFHTTNDSEVISYIITQERLKSKSIEDAIEKAMDKIKGAYCLIPMDFTPFVLAKQKKDMYLLPKAVP